MPPAPVKAVSMAIRISRLLPRTAVHGGALYTPHHHSGRHTQTIRNHNIWISPRVGVPGWLSRRMESNTVVSGGAATTVVEK